MLFHGNKLRSFEVDKLHCSARVLSERENHNLCSIVFTLIAKRRILPLILFSLSLDFISFLRVFHLEIGKKVLI